MFLGSSCNALLRSFLCISAMGASAAPPAASKEVLRLAMPPMPLLLQGDFFARNLLKTPVLSGILLTREHPAGLRKEPSYKGLPLYGHLTLGSGAHTDFIFAIDDEAQAIYVDLNQNGDLTDDSPLAWQTTEKGENGATDCSGNLVIEASFDLGGGKVGHSPLLVNMNHTTGSDRVFARTFHARAGRMSLKGKAYNVMALSMDRSGVFYDDPSKLNNTQSRLGIFFVDWDGDGSFAPWGHRESYDLGTPVDFQGQWVSFQATADGAKLVARTCLPPPEAKFKQRPLRAVGEKALDFEFKKPDGSSARLSDFAGKVVVLEFWAPWCGPCQKALPEVEKLWTSVKADPRVQFLGLCVADDRVAFDKWITEKGAGFSFTMGWDPAGKTQEGKDQMYLWGVSGIPHVFVVGPDGTIVASLSGFNQESEEKLKKALEAQDIKVR